MWQSKNSKLIVTPTIVSKEGKITSAILIARMFLANVPKPKLTLLRFVYTLIKH